MKTWWTEERLAKLHAEADSWLGTPFGANCATKGIGVSCQHLAGCIYTACGYPIPLEVPDIPIAHARFATTSFVAAYFASRSDFVPVPLGQPIQPGDALGFRLGKCVHHIGLALGGNQFLHVVEGCGVVRSSIEDATWASRLENVWRFRV